MTAVPGSNLNRKTIMVFLFVDSDIYFVTIKNIMNLSFFITLAWLITGMLSLYGLTLLSVSALTYRKKRKAVIAIGDSGNEVTILIPCYNEGSILVDTLCSLENQDYPGKKNIYLLFNDKKDTSLPFL